MSYAAELIAQLQDAIAQEFFPSRGDHTSRVPVIHHGQTGRVLELMRWDLIPFWWKQSLAEKKFSSFNARSDSLENKSTFRGAWKQGQRCIIPATAFYEWPDKDKLPAGAKRLEKQIHVSDQPLISIAGIWDEWMPKNDGPMLSCAMITTEANTVMASLPHDRMPFILPSPDMVTEWLDTRTSAEKAFAMIKPYAGEMVIDG